MISRFSDQTIVDGHRAANGQETDVLLARGIAVTALAIGGLFGFAAPVLAESPPPLPPPPPAGSEAPGDTIRTLTNQGYDVKIEWTDGYPSNIPLSECTVTDIDIHATPLAYVMVNCPADGSQ
jgi:hypothetical protein